MLKNLKLKTAYMENTNLLPKHFQGVIDFTGSGLNSCEAEKIARNIIVVQKKIDPNKWTPFSFEDYIMHCSHTVTDTEKGIIEALVNGGKPVVFTTKTLTPGYLEKDSTTGHYSVTEKFLKAIAPFVKN